MKMMKKAAVAALALVTLGALTGCLAMGVHVRDLNNNPGRYFNKQVSVNGNVVYHSAAASVSSAGISAVQIGNNSAAQGFTIVADNILVSNGTTSTSPTNTSPPVISGTAVVNQTLTAAPGTWSGTAPITYTYQWQRCDNAGASCADILNATAATYVLTSSDVGFTPCPMSSM